MANQPLLRDFNYFIAHQSELVKKYPGKIIVIKDEVVIGSFSDELSAVRETSKKHELGTFIVQRCEPGPSAYTASFHGYHVKFPACGA